MRVNLSSLFKNNFHFKSNRSRWFLIGGLLLILVIIWRMLSYEMHHQKPINSAITVVIAAASQQDVPVTLSALGTITPTDSITVKTQVNGELLQVYFQEGQTVKAGDLLAQIDPRTYQAQLTQYQGQLSRDQALLANAKLDANRYKILSDGGFISRQTYDTQKSLVKQYEGTVQIDQGLIQSTQVNLSNCRITAPTDGRIGLRLVDPGNFVQTTDSTGIAVITHNNPMTVVFTLPEDDASEIMDELNHQQSLKVEIYDRTNTQLLATGQLLTIDNQIDQTTGTIKLKATVPNTKNLLFPNQFVNVKLYVKTIKDAIVVPTAAVLRNNDTSTYLYLYNPDTKTVHVQPIKAGIDFDNNTVITTGVNLNQSVVIDGTDQLTDNATVQAMTQNTQNTQDSQNN